MLVIEVSVTPRTCGPRENQDIKDHLDKEGMYVNIKSLLDNPERNVTNMFALRNYFDADEDS